MPVKHHPVKRVVLRLQGRACCKNRDDDRLQDGNLGNFMRMLALPNAVHRWLVTTLRDKLVKIGAKIVRHGRYIIFQMAEIAIPRDLFADILRRIDRLRPKPCPA